MKDDDTAIENDGEISEESRAPIGEKAIAEEETAIADQSEPENAEPVYDEDDSDDDDEDEDEDVPVAEESKPVEPEALPPAPKKVAAPAKKPEPVKKSEAKKAPTPPPPPQMPEGADAAPPAPEPPQLPIAGLVKITLTSIVESKDENYPVFLNAIQKAVRRIKKKLPLSELQVQITVAVDVKNPQNTTRSWNVAMLPEHLGGGYQLLPIQQ